MPMTPSAKRAIAASLLELVEQKPLEKISVSDIVKHAHVGRQTFYNHFKDKNDLIYWIFCRTLSGERALMEHAGLRAYLTKLYTEAQKYRRFLKQACRQEGQNALSDAIYQQTYTYYKNWILRRHGSAVLTNELEFALQFNAHGASDLYVQWAKDGMPGNAQDQANYAFECMPRKIKALLN